MIQANDRVEQSRQRFPLNNSLGFENEPTYKYVLQLKDATGYPARGAIGLLTFDWNF